MNLHQAVHHVMACDNCWEGLMRARLDKGIADIEAYLDVHAVWGQP